MGKPTQRNTTADIFSPGLVDEYVPYKSMEQDGLLIKGPFPLTNSEAHAFSAGYVTFYILSFVVTGVGNKEVLTSCEQGTSRGSAKDHCLSLWGCPGTRGVAFIMQLLAKAFFIAQP
eukprot:1156461-Pelagomonas_calceolata.AAC.4